MSYWSFIGVSFLCRLFVSFVFVYMRSQRCARYLRTHLGLSGPHGLLIPLHVPPPPLQPPPPPRRPSFPCFSSIVLVCVAHLLYAWPCIAFPLLQIKHLCVFCDILSPKALYGSVVLLLQTQDVFSR